MPDQTPATQTIVQRLEKIERQNRTMKCAGLAVLIVVGSIVLMGQASPQSRIIDADAFVLKDAGGKMRASLRMNTTLDSPELKLYDSNGKSRVEINAATKQPSIWLFDGEGRKRGAFATDEDSAGLQLFDPTGKVRAILVTDQNGPGLDLSGANSTRAGLYVAPEGPGLSLYDSGGKRRAGMGVTADGSNVVLYDNQERARAGLAVNSAGPLFSVLDADGKALWSAPNATELPRPAGADRKPRVFIEASSGSWFLKPERKEDPSEERTQFVQACTQAMVTIDKQNADYTLRLEHHLAAGAVFKNPPPDYNLDFWKSSLFDVEGSQLSGQSSPTLSGSVDTVCRSILKDWGSKSR